MNKFFKFWLPVIIWMGVIFIFSSIPNLKSELKEDYILRKIAHILEFAILTFLLIRCLVQEKLSIKKIVIYSIIFAIFYALIDEYHQSFILGRQGTLKDVGIDGIGILLIAVLWYYKNRNPAPQRVQGRGRQD